jgi:hypothetical protein
MSSSSVPRGPGLFAIGRATGETLITNIRRIAGAERAPGSALVSAAAILLALLGAGLFVVTLAAQYRYVFAAKHQAIPSMIEAAALDLGMAIFSLLALGLAMAGQSARSERALIVACALGSAGMNYAGADVGSPRSVAAYVVPPLFLAVVVDRVVAVVRRHVLGDSERSAWAAAGKAALYLLRLVLALPSTASGLRRLVLELTPLPEASRPAVPAAAVPAIEGPAPAEPPELSGATKKARLAWHYKQDPGYGDRAATGAAARRLARLSGSARAPPGPTSGRSSPAWTRQARHREPARRRRRRGDPRRRLVRAVHRVLGQPYPGHQMADPAQPAPRPGVRLDRRARHPLGASGGAAPRPTGAARAEAAPPAPGPDD